MLRPCSGIEQLYLSPGNVDVDDPNMESLEIKGVTVLWLAYTHHPLRNDFHHQPTPFFDSPLILTLSLPRTHFTKPSKLLNPELSNKILNRLSQY